MHTVRAEPIRHAHRIMRVEHIVDEQRHLIRTMLQPNRGVHQAIGLLHIVWATQQVEIDAALMLICECCRILGAIAQIAFKRRAQIELELGAVGQIAARTILHIAQPRGVGRGAATRAGLQLPGIAGRIGERDHLGFGIGKRAIQMHPAGRTRHRFDFDTLCAQFADVVQLLLQHGGAINHNKLRGLRLEVVVVGVETGDIKLHLVV